MPENRRKNNPFREIHSEGTYYTEEILLEKQRPTGPAPGLLHLFCYGESLFRSGAEIPIRHSYWAIQWITGGSGNLHYREERFKLKKGNLFLVPPGEPYLFRISPKETLRKKYLLFNPGPVISILGNLEMLRKEEVVLPTEQDRIETLFDRIRETIRRCASGWSTELSTLGYAMFAELAYQLGRSGKKGEFEIMLEGITASPEADDSLDALADKFHVGKRTLNRLFRKYVNCTPVQYLIRMRLEYAAHLLALNTRDIRTVAEECDYRDAAFFSREFKKHYGVSPREYHGKQPQRIR